MAEGVVFPFPSLPLNEGRTYGQPEVVLISYGFSQLRALEFFVFRKMEMPETQNPPAMRVESICL